MKRFLILVLAVCAASSAARSQACRNCPSTRPDEQEREQRAKELRDHDKWPERPKLPPSFPRPYYARTEVKFAVTNEAAKKVKEITWECILVHPKTTDQIAKYIIVTRKQIAPYRGAILRKRVEVPLALFYGPKVISVDQVGKEKDDLPRVVQALQSNRIVEIKYADGSVDHPE